MFFQNANFIFGLNLLLTILWKDLDYISMQNAHTQKAEIDSLQLLRLRVLLVWTEKLDTRLQTDV